MGFNAFVSNNLKQVAYCVPLLLVGFLLILPGYATEPDWQNIAPTADAGDSQSVTEGSLVTLDASGSFDPNGEEDILSYSWEQINGIQVTLSDASAVKPTFTAPELSESTITLEFVLTVTDVAGQKATDSVHVIVSHNHSVIDGGGGGSTGCFISCAVQ